MDHKGTVTLKTKRLVLRRFTEDDAADVFKRWSGCAENSRFVMRSPHTSVAQTTQMLREYINNYKKSDFYMWGIVFCGNLIGYICGNEINEEIKSVCIGYCVTKSCWNKGITTEAAGAVIGYFFSVGFNRVFSYYNPQNPASGRVMEKCGMRFKGKIRGGSMLAGEICDCLQYTILAEDYNKTYKKVSAQPMKTESKMMELILGVARADERIRAVLLCGSRANPAAPKDKFRDFDVTFFVKDIAPFYDNPAWVEEKFGKPLIMQMPEAMRYPTGDGNFNYMMIYPDGSRLDLGFDFTKYTDNGEPVIALLDKDGGNGFLPPLPERADSYWHIKPPSPLFYYSCCNNFWWCLNNVAKGIARDELPYVMHMLNDVVRSELHDMICWYIGTEHGFNLSAGKNGKYIKKYLPPKLYAQYAATYSGSHYDDIRAAIDNMCDLFHTLAAAVAEHFNFSYRQNEEDGIRAYLRMVREGCL